MYGRPVLLPLQRRQAATIFPHAGCRCCWASTESAQSTMAAEADRMFLADTAAARFAMPWQSFTPAAELEPEKDYYCVMTWGVMSLAAAPAFWRRTTQISVAGLPRGQCVGESSPGR